MKKKILTLLFCCICTVNFAQDIKRPESYNYTRGVEAVQNDKTEEALEYLNKEVQENPENGYAYSWIATVRYELEEYGRALTAVNLAIKHIPKKDKEYKAFSHTLRAMIYTGLEEYDNALKDYTTAIEYEPEDIRVYEKRAQLYYEQEKLDLSDKDYLKMIEIDPGNTMGYMGIGRNANKQEKYEDAIKRFDYAIKLANDYPSGYSFRAESYIGLKEYNKAADDIITALNLNYDNKAFYLMGVMADSAFNVMSAKLKIQEVKFPNNDYWAYCLGIVHEETNQHKKAVEHYTKSFNKGQSPVVASRIADCYDELGNYDLALKYINEAVRIDSTDYSYIETRANIHEHSGMRKEAIEDMDFLISKYPDYYFVYYRRGWLKDHGGDIDGALEDYTMAITLEPEFRYVYLNRGNLYRLKGMIKEAEADFKTVLEKDTIPEKYSCRQYAHFYLGEKEEAIKCMNIILKNENSDGNNYDAACLYSLMGEKEKSLSHLRKAFELGYRKFHHARVDRDLNNIRTLKEFEDLLKEYEEVHQQEIDSNKGDSDEYEEKVVEIPFTKEGEVCKVKCSINGLPLYLIFDTGASDVSMSDVEANFMFKNEYLTSQDVEGRQNYMTADGNVVAGTVVNLRNVNFGGVELNNIQASIVKNQRAPLLLGQSVLKRLGKIEIDNEKRILKITYKEKKK